MVRYRFLPFTTMLHLILPYAPYVWQRARHNFLPEPKKPQPNPTLLSLCTCHMGHDADQVLLFSGYMSQSLARATLLPSFFSPYRGRSEFSLKGRAVCWLTLSYSWRGGFQPNSSLQVLRAFWTLCLLLSNPVAMFSTPFSVTCTYVEKATLPTWKMRNIMLLLLHLNDRYSQETTFLRSFFSLYIQGDLGSWSEKCVQLYISVWLHLLTI